MVPNAVLPAVLPRNRDGQASVTYRLVYACRNNLLVLLLFILIIIFNGLDY